MTASQRSLVPSVRLPRHGHSATLHHEHEGEWCTGAALQEGRHGFVHGDAQVLLALALDPHHRVIDKLRHQRDVVRQNADLTGGGASEQEGALARPDVAVDRDDVDVQFGHLTSPFGAGKG